jgi:hypothetical protein
VRDHVREKLNPRDDSKLEKPLTLRKPLIAAGMKEPARKPNGEAQRFQISPTCKTQIVTNFEIRSVVEWTKELDEGGTLEQLRMQKREYPEDRKI